MTTTRQVTVSSRLIAAVFETLLGLGRTCYDKRLPDAIWTAPDEQRQALLSGLWDGDGSWSFLQGGPSAVYEYGTVSRELADGMLRLLADLGVMARLKVGRTAKSTVDTYWLVISGSRQLADCHWLVGLDDWIRVRTRALRQTKSIAPTGYRRLSKSAAWVRVTSTERRTYTGDVFSLEVPGPHTVVATHGLVAHNCFPKDSHALVRIAENSGYQFGLLRSVIAVNEEQFGRVANKITRFAGGAVEGKTIAVWGLTFKARTDDMRDSPAINIINRLLEVGATVRAYDPAIADGSDPRLAGVEVVTDPYEAVTGADVLAVLTEWPEFADLDIAKVGDLIGTKAVVDGRNLLDGEALKAAGFAYDGIGRS